MNLSLVLFLERFSTCSERLRTSVHLLVVLLDKLVSQLEDNITYFQYVYRQGKYTMLEYFHIQLICQFDKMFNRANRYKNL